VAYGDSMAGRRGWPVRGGVGDAAFRKDKRDEGTHGAVPPGTVDRRITWQAEPRGRGSCGVQRRDRGSARLRTSAVRNAEGAASCGSKPRPPLW